MFPKPVSTNELKDLIENGDIEIMLEGDIGGELTKGSYLRSQKGV